MKDDGHAAKFVRAAKSAEDICQRFEQQDPAAFPMTGEAWLQLSRMSYDSTLGLPDLDKAPAPVKPKTFPSFTKEYRKTAYDALDPTLPALSAEDKSIAVTGDGSGIGAATALRLSQAGASSISIIGRRANNLESTRSNTESLVPGAQVYTSDVAQKDAMNATFKAIHDHVGEIHVLVNNAGYKPTVAPAVSAIKDLDVEEWWRCFEVNIKGSFLASQSFLQYKSTDAVVLYVTTALSHFTGFPSHSSYSSSKAGAVRVFSTLQAEHPELRVVCVHLGVINTAGKVSGAKQAGEPDDVSLPAGTMVWLASPKADFLKGKYIWANWDVTSLAS
ncbi:hypothetical protein G7Y89_g15654 [Cudoniella acicularis]|uniref:NAD(P)-binding protein n=1 Tax=Cudoniella acicularis TaxID=354080 RepID=A0A8H4QHU6_9HELO|nr:hypothetical protein G7Y89_g15654 [Cudoniella acicularis]